MLVTTTFFPKKPTDVERVRATLTVSTVKEASRLGYQIIIVDGSPDTNFKEELRALGATVITQIGSGMGASRREAIHAGLLTQKPVVVWLEPEKWPMVVELEKCITDVIEGRADVVIPFRKTFTNYPDYQRRSEVQGNAEIAHITGRYDLDYFVGPRVMNRRAAIIMATYDSNAAAKVGIGDKWEILFVPIIEFFHNGMKVTGVFVDYVHPSEQSVEDDAYMRSKRDEQRKCLVGAIAITAKILGYKRP